MEGGCLGFGNSDNVLNVRALILFFALRGNTRAFHHCERFVNGIEENADVLYHRDPHLWRMVLQAVSYTHLTLPTIRLV